MTADGSVWFELSYLDADGRRRSDLAAAGRELTSTPALRLRQLRLAHGPEVWQLLPAQDAAGASDLAAAYERLDNEILAGLRLHRLASRCGGDYPAQLSQLYGYDADSVQPFALLLPWRGRPVGSAAARMQWAEKERFQVSLLRGLSWIAAAGIAHRGVGVASVRWDHERQEAQITDFSLATVVGVPRSSAGTRPWAGPEQRAVTCTGLVSDRDDLWGAGQLLYYLHVGEPLSEPVDLRAVTGLSQQIGDLFASPERRPTARELLSRLNVADPVPAELRDDPLDPGRVRYRVGSTPGAEADPDQPTTADGAVTVTLPSRQRRWRRWLPFLSAGGQTIALAYELARTMPR